MVGFALYAALFPQVSNWLVFDRQAISGGEIWRLFTGHGVHFSMSHLLCDAGAVAIAGFIIEQNRPRDFKWFCLSVPWTIGIACFFFEPQMEIYGGLSGIATALLAYMAIQGLTDRSAWKWICAMILCLIPVKVFCEASSGRPLFASGLGDTQLCVTSHVAGALFALGWTVLTKLRTGNAQSTPTGKAILHKRQNHRAAIHPVAPDLSTAVREHAEPRRICS